ncbi:MAG: Fe-S cluster assembly ATPase SufC [Anaerolineae bacterium]|nr:Fe-S cluster assembly ATPase SufC [Anaerolineales bacterium]MCK6629548.1 Fe-S cluster assembly ATPase SufC [Anaerolineae bacterium]MCQ3978323.1 Fe-S cluster assembly ATPase SufC [Anaerolineae bacterium]
MSLVIKDLRVSIDEKPILKGLNLEVGLGEVHAIMGPNGSGKSTLAYALAGHPKYEVEDGEVWMDDVNLLELTPDERAKMGLFLAFQYPTAIPGISMANFLRTAVNAVKGEKNGDGKNKGIPITEFRKLMTEKMNLLKIDKEFARRYLNEGFSGGEKKRAEILQMALLEPKYAILDETDSGLDIDALKVVSEGVNALTGPNRSFIVITHYQRILNYVKPDFVHILYNGQIIESGGPELALRLEQEGYDNLIKEKEMEAA